MQTHLEKQNRFASVRTSKCT